MRKSRDFQTRFQSVSVWKSRLATEFRVAGAIHAAYHKNRYLNGLAWDIIAAGALLHPSSNPSSILMLGVAGGTSLRTLRVLLPEATFTGIDLDSELIELARSEMRLSETNAKIIIADAYEWLRRNKDIFDVIIDDLYLAGETDVFRSSHCNDDWLSTITSSLASDGILVLNLVTGPGHRSKQSQVRKHLLNRFPVVRSVHTPGSLNEVLVAGNETSTRSRLSNLVQYFKDPRDRHFWNSITVKKLYPVAPSLSKHQAGQDKKAL